MVPSALPRPVQNQEETEAGFLGGAGGQTGNREPKASGGFLCVLADLGS